MDAPVEWDDTTASVYELQYQADDRQPDEHGDGAVYQCLTAFGNERSDFATVAAGQEAEIGGRIGSLRSIILILFATAYTLIVMANTAVATQNRLMTNTSTK